MVRLVGCLCLFSAVLSGFAVADAGNSYKELQTLFNGTHEPLDLAGVPAMGLAKVRGVTSRGEKVQSNVLFSTTTIAAKSQVRSHEIDDSIPVELAAAHFKACNGFIPEAALSTDKTALRTWASYSTFRFLKFAPNGAITHAPQSATLWRKTKKDNQSILVGRVDILDAGFTWFGFTFTGFNVVGHAYFVSDRIEEVAFTPAPKPDCRVASFPYTGQPIGPVPPRAPAPRIREHNPSRLPPNERPING